MERHGAHETPTSQHGARPSPRAVGRPASLALALIGVILVTGTLGYQVIEGWSTWDALYMTVITVTTVGYREVHPMSRAGEAFTAALLLLGVGSVFYAVTLFAARLVEGGVQGRWAARQQARMIDSLAQHFIVCGYGRIGSIIVDEFRRQGIAYVVIERDHDRVQALIDRGGVALCADSSSEDVLTTVHIERARGLIAAVGTDAENVYTVLTARLLRPDLYIISRAETEDAVKKLRRAGADKVLAPYQIGGIQMAQTALRPAVVDFVQIATSAAHLDLSMEQIRVDAGGALAGRTLADANVRQRYGVIVVAIQLADGRMEFNPAAERSLAAGDHLVALGPPERLRELTAAVQVGHPMVTT